MEGYKLAHRIDWEAGDCAGKISRNQSGRQQRTQPGQATGLVWLGCHSWHFTVSRHVSFVCPVPTMSVLSPSVHLQKWLLKMLALTVQTWVASEALVTKEWGRAGFCYCSAFIVGGMASFVFCDSHKPWWVSRDQVTKQWQTPTLAPFHQEKMSHILV